MKEGETSAGEVRGRLPSWRVGTTHNKAHLHLFPCLLFYSHQLCISVHGSYASPRIANGKMDTLKKFFFATFFKQTFAYNNSYLVLAVHQMKDSYRNLDYGRINTDPRKNTRKKEKANEPMLFWEFPKLNLHYDT